MSNKIIVFFIQIVYFWVQWGLGLATLNQLVLQLFFKKVSKILHGQEKIFFLLVILPVLRDSWRIREKPTYFGKETSGVLDCFTACCLSLPVKVELRIYNSNKTYTTSNYARKVNSSPCKQQTCRKLLPYSSWSLRSI